MQTDPLWARVESQKRWRICSALTLVYLLIFQLNFGHSNTLLCLLPFILPQVLGPGIYLLFHFLFCLLRGHGVKGHVGQWLAYRNI